MNEIIKHDAWYSSLVSDLKKLAFEGIVKTKHAIGKRILEDELKFGKSEYGSKRIENLAIDLNVGKTELYYCIQFAKKFPELSGIPENVSWMTIYRKHLPKPRKEKPETPPLPEGKYNVIYADPPWQYDNTGFSTSAEQQYSTMETSDICALNIQDRLADNCVLFLWVTNPFVPDGIKVIEAWGFNYKTLLCWIKEGPRIAGFYAYGENETLFIATTGSMLPTGELPGTLIRAPKKRHSEKPEIVYKIIERMYPGCKYLELFARNEREGWDSWGLEVCEPERLIECAGEDDERKNS